MTAEFALPPAARKTLSRRVARPCRVAAGGLLLIARSTEYYRSTIQISFDGRRYSVEFVLTHARTDPAFQVRRPFRAARALQPRPSNFCIFCLLRTPCTLVNQSHPHSFKKTTEGGGPQIADRQRRPLCTSRHDRALFSTTSKLPFPQPFSFHIYTNCPRGWGPRANPRRVVLRHGCIRWRKTASDRRSSFELQISRPRKVTS
jgi:hypothetical protein